ncbi:MAG: methylglyoxal reductase (NADPH-dependent) gre2 [Alectoria sarmentosa]|nr:MAG: methylglyoxal reductase (NADPH-dependent) gre2 [Alectoria sarmentosa]
MSSIVDKATEKVSELTGSSKPKSSQLILVTGASGFVAAHVLNSLFKEGYKVRGTVRSEATANKVRKTHGHHLKGDDSRLTFAIVPDIAVPGAFDESVKGVDGVFHTASPFVMQVEDNVRDLLDPAVKGTTSILEAVEKNAPQVKRVVVTSSFAAIGDPMKGARPGYTYSEKDWNPVTYDEAKNGPGVIAYCASKTFAEKAAYDFVKDKKPNFDIATICPPMIYGPLEHGASLESLNTSSADIYRLMNGSSKEPGPTSIPCFADVRDVGEAHVKAYESKEGGRYFISTSTFSYPQVCEIIKKALPSHASKVPDCSTTEEVETFTIDNEHAQKALGIHFTSLEKTITDTAKSLAKLETAAA